MKAKGNFLEQLSLITPSMGIISRYEMLSSVVRTELGIKSIHNCGYLL